jgi:hypothetical protein
LYLVESATRLCSFSLCRVACMVKQLIGFHTKRLSEIVSLGLEVKPAY